MFRERAPTDPTFIGHSTWMSRIGSYPWLRGRWRATRWTSVSTTRSGVPASTQWKSLVSPRPGSSGSLPVLMRWALVMIRLLAACRNTSVSRTTATMPLPLLPPGPPLPRPDAAVDYVPPHPSGSDAGQLVDVADQQQRHAGWHGPEQRVHQ